jgi:hypothetical protein
MVAAISNRPCPLLRLVTSPFLDVVQVNCKRRATAEWLAPTGGTTRGDAARPQAPPGIHPRRRYARVRFTTNEKVPFMQQLLDNPFLLLLFLGVMIPMMVYSLWGVIDILTVPLAK